MSKSDQDKNRKSAEQRRVIERHVDAGGTVRILDADQEYAATAEVIAGSPIELPPTTGPNPLEALAEDGGP